MDNVAEERALQPLTLTIVSTVCHPGSIALLLQQEAGDDFHLTCITDTKDQMIIEQGHLQGPYQVIATEPNSLQQSAHLTASTYSRSIHSPGQRWNMFLWSSSTNLSWSAGAWRTRQVKLLPDAMAWPDNIAAVGDGCIYSKDSRTGQTKKLWVDCEREEPYILEDSLNPLGVFSWGLLSGGKNTAVAFVREGNVHRAQSLDLYGNLANVATIDGVDLLFTAERRDDLSFVYQVKQTHHGDIETVFLAATRGTPRRIATSPMGALTLQNRDHGAGLMVARLGPSTWDIVGDIHMPKNWTSVHSFSIMSDGQVCLTFAVKRGRPKLACVDQPLLNDL